MTMSARAGVLYEAPRSPRRRPEPIARRIISEAGERNLGAELRRLRHQLQVEFPARLREARGYGEIDHNDDYLQIKEEEAVVASRAHRLATLLGSATVVKASGAQRGVASIGSVVEVEDLASGDVREYRLTGGYEEMRANDISANSPIGQALLGRQRGDEVTVELPGDRSVVLGIIAIRPQRP